MNKRKLEFKIEIGTRFKDDKRDLVIIDRKILTRYRKDKIKCNDKYYKYKCYKCGFACGEHYKNQEYKEELWIEESHLLNQKQGCSCCGGNSIVVEGYNDIPTTSPWMIKYFQDGIEEAKLYTANSSKRIYPVCPDCGRIKSKKITINSIYKYNDINCSCSDKIPYTEKFMFSVLEQLGLDLQTQLSKTTFKWCNKYYYDFYFESNNEQYIIETHGIQHYEETKRKNAKTLEEEQENDKLKKELALANGIKPENYIVIDCRYSTLEWIRDNENGILNSKLGELFDLSEVNWFKTEEFAYSNLIKIACEYKNNNSDMTVEEISELIGCSVDTTNTYLKKGSKYRWCDYDPRERQRNIASKNGKLHGKQVEIFNKDISLGIFPSCAELERQSKKLFGVKLTNSVIAKVCRGELKQHKGFTFKYCKNKLTEIC